MRGHDVNYHTEPEVEALETLEQIPSYFFPIQLISLTKGG